MVPIYHIIKEITLVQCLAHSRCSRNDVATIPLRCCARAFLQLLRAGGALQLRDAGFSAQWRLLFQSMGSRRVGLGRCSTRLRRAVRSPRESGLSDCGTWHRCAMAGETFPNQGLNPRAHGTYPLYHPGSP